MPDLPQGLTPDEYYTQTAELTRAILAHPARPIPIRPDEADLINSLFHPNGPRPIPVDGMEGDLCGRPIRIDAQAPSLLHHSPRSTSHL